MSNNIIYFSKSDTESNTLTIPIHYLTNGKVFRPIRSTNVFESSLIDFLNNHFKKYHIQSLANICVSNNYVEKCNNICTNIDYYNNYDTSEHYYEDCNNCENLSIYDDDFIQAVDKAINKAFSIKSKSMNGTNSSNSTNSIHDYTKTPLNCTNCNTNDTNSNISTHHYIAVKNDPLDCVFSEWYNNNKERLNWKRVRRGVYNIEGKLVNFSLVNGDLFVKIIDNFTKKAFNMPINVYYNKYKAIKSTSQSR